MKTGIKDTKAREILDSRGNPTIEVDIPVVGPRTVKILNKVHAKCLAIEAHKTLVIDRELCIKDADRNNIAIVAL